MTEKNKLLQTLFDDPDTEHLDIKFLRGTSATLTEEDLCRQANNAIAQFKQGNLKAVESIEEDFEPVEAATL